MSKSYRDQRAWKARNGEKAVGKKIACHRWAFCSSEEAEGLKEYHKIKPPYINSYAILGKRRRNTSRKSNQRTKQMIHQIQRAKEKIQTLKTKNELYHE